MCPILAVTELWPILHSRTFPRVNRRPVVMFSQLQTERSSYLDTWLVAKACGERRATRAVHNRAAACVAAGGGITENHL